MKIVGNQLTVTDITADMQKLASDRGTRDYYIRTHGIDSDKYKQSTFKLTKPVALPAGAEEVRGRATDRDGIAHAARRDPHRAGSAPGPVVGRRRSRSTPPTSR